jgi:GT2 family glycosyltransferase
MVEDRAWTTWVSLIRSPVNYGFAGGNNLALQAVHAERYLMLNSDAFVRPGAIAELMRALDQRPDVGLVGPRIEWPDGTPQNTCYRIRTPLTELLAAARSSPLTRLFSNHEGTYPIPMNAMEPGWTSFACVLVRREVFEQVGLLDPGYFMYFDDLDYCRRARSAGWRILHWPTARVVHLRGQSGPLKQLAESLKRRPAYFYASRNRYYAKFYGRLGLWMTNLLWEFGRFIAWGREMVGNKDPHICQKEVLDVWINWLDPMAMPKLPEPSNK